MYKHVIHIAGMYVCVDEKTYDRYMYKQNNDALGVYVCRI